MDTLFQHASDRTGFPYLSRISPDFFWICFWLAMGFCAIHAIRRAHTSPPGKPVAGYNTNQRIYHWGNFLLLTLVGVSGYFLFFRSPPNAPFGFTWLQIHFWSGVVFAVGVVLHAIFAIKRGDWGSMRPRWSDFRNTFIIWKNFTGRTNDYPSSGKYDALQKIYHHILALLAITFTTSGVWMWLSADRIYFAGRDWLHFLRLVHDASAVLLVVMIVGHIYFSLIKANRAHLRDMAGLAAATQESKGDD